MYSDTDSYAPLARIDTPDGAREYTRIYWYHTRPDGTPELLSDSNGEEVWRIVNDAWGRVDTAWGEINSAAVREDNLRMQGQYLDRETGLHYNLFRYYDADSMHFISPDPIGLAGGLNLYAYAPDPVNWIDPLGLRKCSSSRKPEKVKSKSTGRTKVRNKNELFALDHVKKHPENGMEIIKSDQIGDPHFKGKGWSKMEQKINGVIVHYMAKIDKNSKMTHVTDFKIKD